MPNANDLYVPRNHGPISTGTMPPHFHAKYGSDEVLVSIREIEILEGHFPSKQLKMLLGWAAFRQEELMENWELARNKQELFPIAPPM